MSRTRPVFLTLFLASAGCDCRGPRLSPVFDAGCVEEVCDGLDNDCNGRVDDLPNVRCGMGACERVVLACLEGRVAVCTPGDGSAEVCDGLDNDCNGVVDDGLPEQRCGVGACATTAAACARCEPGAGTDERCDGVDNDCDGETDESLGVTTCGVGACQRTVAACDGGSCTPGLPQVETCNQLDDDCNGVVDDGVCNPPVVLCPQAVTVRVGDSVSLSAQATAGDSAISSTRWSVTTQPAGSAATLSMANTLVAGFAPDRDGAYTLSFCATDVGGLMGCCTTVVNTTSCASPPSPPATTACGTSWDGRPIVQFSPVPAGLQYQLTAQGAPMVLASATSGQNWLRPATRIAPGGPIPGSPVSLEVRSCRVADLSCCSSPTPLSVNVVELCNVPTPPTRSNIVLSEYVINGAGACPSPDCVSQDTCQAGESVEITNLSNCPVSLDGFHFAYRNATASAGSVRWMNFGAADVIPPRGVYVAIRGQQFAPSCATQLGVESPGLYGLNISSLQMQGTNLCSGWFNNSGGGMSELRIAPGSVATAAGLMFTPGVALARVAPYLTTSSASGCPSIGFDAVDSCGSVAGSTAPASQLTPNQLGRLWHPCDAVVAPVPTCVRD